MNYAFAGNAALMVSYHPEETQLNKIVKWLRSVDTESLSIFSGKKAMCYANKLIQALIAESLRLHDALLWDITIKIYEVGIKDELIR
ncbi:hypothetical protein SGGMMB4_02758 [Sodalis glossinidius str. 'morsitans']|uniref:Uncharacterized protein n=1 Tax=Sodalis glossinidius (strain morsitans) TaxID=343509 RepID=A0A193QJ56_SODGM|nr:hypothetical protein [Sodalis glossinidius]CRL45201.1 hypothetical protein SGGMMB4_02758 [Sodalis glossinidius str. 'morsitans']